MDNKKPKIITIASIKSGVGKSTSAIIFAALLANDCEVLLIDMDTQASVTSYFYKKIVESEFNLLEKKYIWDFERQYINWQFSCKYQ